MDARILTAACAACLFAGPALSASYKIVELGALEFYKYSVPRAINASGQVVGESDAVPYWVASTSHAFVWNEAEGMKDIGYFNSYLQYSTANDINDSGQVVGFSSFSNSDYAAFYWDPRYDGPQHLYAPQVGQSSFATGINSLGKMAGYINDYGINRAVLWEPLVLFQQPTMQFLGGLPGGDGSSEAYALNDAGQVVGLSGAATGTRGFLWDAANGMLNLGDLPGGVDYSQASDIYDARQVVGMSEAATGWRGFLWDAANGMQDLGDLPGGDDYSYASGINNAGQVVGGSRAATGTRLGRTAFIWDEINGMQDLNEMIDDALGWKLTSARDINDNGWIVGSGENSAGRDRALLLIPNTAVAPVPLPAALPMMAGCLMALGLMGAKLRSRGRQGEGARADA